MGVLLQIVQQYKGQKLSANLPYKVEFMIPVEGSKDVKLIAHLVWPAALPSNTLTCMTLLLLLRARTEKLASCDYLSAELPPVLIGRHQQRSRQPEDIQLPY